MGTELRPVNRGERIELLDILRGFALLGILLVNFWGDVGERMPAIDRAVDTGLIVLVDSSFYPLFSFLFGLGFAIQLLRARERGTGVAGVYLRRMLALLLIGTAHAVLIWNGDILVNYSLLGLLLIPLHRIPVRPLAALIAVLFLFHIYGTELETALASRRGASPEELHAAELRQGLLDERFRLARGIRDRESGGAPSYADDVAVRWHQHVAVLARHTDLLGMISDDVLLFFLVGLFVGKKRWLSDAERHRSGLAATAVVSLVLVVPAAIHQQTDFSLGGLGDELSWWAANYGLTAFYVATIALFVTAAGPAARRLRALAPAGMMALTNYLMQSLVMTWLFLSYGVGFTRPSTTGWVVLNVAFFFGVQVPLSHWWMKRFRFGPVEWVWRCMTYGELQPLRRREEAETPAAPPPGFQPTAAAAR